MIDLPPFLLFDLGNTLVYYEGDWDEVLRAAQKAVLEAFRARGLVLDQAAFLAGFDASLRAYYTQRERDLLEHTTVRVLHDSLSGMALPAQPEDLVHAGLQAFYAVTQRHWRAEPEVVQVLAALKARGCRLGVVSNAAYDPDVQAQVDKAGLRPHLDFVLTSAAFGLRKPSPEIFLHALKHWDASPHQAAMVGDTLNADILGANRTGLTSIWLTRFAGTPANEQDLQSIRPDHTIQSLRDLLE